MLSISFHSKNKSTLQPTGFGLIELLVSISIMALIMGVILTRQSSFNGAVLLRSQAYELALQLREIQLSAVSATSIEGSYRTLLGASFRTANPQNYEIAEYTLTSGNVGSPDTYGQQGIIDKRFEISQIRRVIGPTNKPPMSGVIIIFERPNFDARFYQSNGNPLPSSVTAIEIDIRRIGATGDPSGVFRTVEVTRSGQITVLDI